MSPIRCLYLPAAAVIALTFALAACRSAPTRFYTLLAPEPADAPALRAPFQLEVLPVDVPAQVEVPQFVIRTGAGEMAKVEARRWIAPLANEIRAALAEDLSRTLGAREVYGLAHGAGLATYRVILKVQRFDSAPGAYARIDAVWTVRPAADEKSTVTCSSSAQETVAAGYEALAQGHQRALAAIAGRIAATISAMQAGTPLPACPA